MNTDSALTRKELAVVLSGEAGQGINTIETLLTQVLKQQGYYVFANKEYMSRIRGGCNSTLIRVSAKPVASYLERIDLLIPLNEASLPHLRARIGEDTLIAASAELLASGREAGLVEDRHAVEVSFDEIAKAAGSRIYANTAAAGLVLGVLGIDHDLIKEFFTERFAAKGEAVQQGNIDAALQGYEAGRKLVEQGRLQVSIASDPQRRSDLLLSGAQSVGLGAIAGGCDYIGAYPMSPATGVLIYLAQQAARFGIAVEQVEDEIAAINMGIGAWFAGARAMTTTSGGGFALMCEGMSLAGMFESPMVVHIAQRPGPATGLPTRTEQGDLELAVYAGHGEYPRIVLAPGSIEQAFETTRRAFDLADEFQVPVVILTDQFLMDSYNNIAELPLPEEAPQRHIVETTADYKRYALTDDGLSPRGIPSYGAGLVSVDSDTHDEAGHITEDLGLRVKMVEKRLKRFDLIAEKSIEPELIGPAEAPNLLVAWGSTLETAREALELSGRSDIALLHFQQVFPVPPGARELLAKAKRVVDIELNATGQFAKLLRLHADAQIDDMILKYDGMPYSLEEVLAAIEDKFPQEA
jgi:2-oxoglutarate/2-oxoacid ferredoxin oxidoreductase subunit alpha